MRVMNIILFNEHDMVDECRIRLADRRFEHVRKVLKSKPSDVLGVGQINGLMGQGRVVTIDDKEVVIEVSLTMSPPMALSITLCLALPRPIMLRRTIFNAVQLGVKHIHLFHSARVEKSFWQSSTLQESALDLIIIDALEQAKDTVLPTITLHRQFKPFIEDQLPSILNSGCLVLAHPEADKTPLEAVQSLCPQQGSVPLVLIVGPEGGFVPYEIEQLQALNAITVSLGPRILRVETAVTVLLSKLVNG